MINIKDTIETIDKNGNAIKLLFVMPGTKIIQEAQMAYNIKISELMRKSVKSDEKLLSRSQLDNYLLDLGIWTKEDQSIFIQLQIQLRDLEKKLKTGGIKVSEARQIAIDMRNKRNELLMIYNKRSQFDEITMESIAEDHRFKFLISRCVLDSLTNQPFFKDINDYINRQDEKASVDSAKVLASHWFGYKENFARDLPENKWLSEYGFVNSDGALIDGSGNLIDSDGRKINKNGRFINDQGELIDIEGNRVDENGELIIESKPLIKDDNIKRKKQKKISKR